MKKKRIRGRIASMIATVLLVALMAVPVCAANYTAVNGNNTSATFKKYLVVKKDAQIPNATFEFKITSGTAQNAANGTMAIYAGPTGGTTGAVFKGTTSATTTVTFTPEDGTTYEEAMPNGETIAFMTKDPEDATDITKALNSDEKYAAKSLTVDLSNVSFTEPGIYRWVITETASTQQGVTDDPVLTRVLDVYVTDVDGELSVSSYVFHEGDGTETVTAGDDYGSADVTTAGAKLNNKSTGFTNTYATQNITFGKEVTGNQGSKDKYFKISIKATAGTVQAADKFTVDLSKAETEPLANAATSYDAETMAAANVAEITGEQLLSTNGKEFYLKDGQYVTIKGLPAGFKYAITEVAEDYKSTQGIAAGLSPFNLDGEEGNDALPAAGLSGTISNADVYTGFTNTRDGIIPTGILLSATPWIIAGIIVVAGIVFFAIRSKKKYDEE